MKKTMITAVLMAAAMTISAASCADKNKSIEKAPDTTPTTEPAEEADPVAGQTVVWLADYDLNPDGGERSTALALFEDFYGGKIKFVRTSQERKFDDLDHMINSGEEVDMFPYEYDVPLSSLSDRFQPLDPYFDILGMDDERWSEMSGVIDSFALGDEHYVIPFGISDAQLLTYSRVMFEEEKLDDPYELFLKDQWDWDTMMGMMEKFVSQAEEGKTRYGICGDPGQAVINSCGHGVVSWNGSELVNRLGSTEVTRSEVLMKDLADRNLYRRDELYCFPNDNSTLFFAMGDWSLGTSNSQNPDSKLWVVPFPKMTGAKENYLTCRFNADMLVKGSKKGAAVAAYINCERIVATDEEYQAAAREAALVTELRAPGMLKYCMNGDQYDAVQTCKDLSRVTPVIECGYSLGRRMNGGTGLTDDTKGVMEKLTTYLLKKNPTAPDWNVLRNSCGDIINEEINK